MSCRRSGLKINQTNPKKEKSHYKEKMPELMYLTVKFVQEITLRLWYGYGIRVCIALPPEIVIGGHVGLSFCARQFF